MKPFGKSPDSGPGTGGNAPMDPKTSIDTEPDTDEPPVEPSPNQDLGDDDPVDDSDDD